jgi:hypothetical protein
MTKTTYPIPQGCTSVTVEQDGETVIVKFETEAKRWRAELFGMYFTTLNGDVVSFPDGDDRYDRMNYNSGNYFRTFEEAQAELDKQSNEQFKSF